MEARKTKQARTVGKGKVSGDVKKKQTEDCVEALLKFGLIEPDLWLFWTWWQGRRTVVTH